MTAKEFGKELAQSLMTGVSFMIPFITAGGILIAIGFAFSGIYVADDTNLWANIFAIGNVSMGLMTAVLGGYIAYSIADKPALAPGFVAGMIAANQGSGFLGAIVGGIAAGCLTKLLKKIKLPVALRSLLPVLIIPLISVLVIGLAMYYIVGVPVAALNSWLQTALEQMSGGALVLLGAVQGAMLASDMGGPINKAAYAFALAATEAGNWAPMAANFIASMSPPLGIALAMLISPGRFTQTQRGSLGGLFVGAFGMITEFAIPFAAAKPLRVIPSLMVGSAVGASLSYLAGLTIQAPHGGLFVIFLCNKPFLFIGILAIAALVTALALIVLTPKQTESTPDDNAIELTI